MSLIRARYADLSQRLQVSLMSLISDCFGTEAYHETFPQLFQADALTQFFICVEDEQAVAAVAVTPLDYLFSGRVLRAACIGTVCVTKSRTGQGLAKRSIAEAIAWSRADKIDLLLLFSTDPRIYEHFGFVYCGMETLIGRKLETQSAGGNIASLAAMKRYRVELFNSDELSEQVVGNLWCIYQRTEMGALPLYSYTDFLNIFKKTKMKVMLVFRSLANIAHHHEDQFLGNVRGVALFGKGADFHLTWHSLKLVRHIGPEFVSDSDDVLKVLVQYAFDFVPESMMHFGMSDAALLHTIESWAKTAEGNNLYKNSVCNLMKIELSSAAVDLFKHEQHFQFPSFLST